MPITQSRNSTTYIAMTKAKAGPYRNFAGPRSCNVDAAPHMHGKPFFAAKAMPDPPRTDPAGGRPIPRRGVESLPHAYQSVDSVEDGVTRVGDLGKLIGRMWLERHRKRDALMDVPVAAEIDGRRWAE